jgi:hypothetical protein
MLSFHKGQGILLSADFILCQSLMKVKGAAEDDWQDTIGDGGRHNLIQLWLLRLLLKLA